MSNGRRAPGDLTKEKYDTQIRPLLTGPTKEFEQLTEYEKHGMLLKLAVEGRKPPGDDDE